MQIICIVTNKRSGADITIINFVIGEVIALKPSIFARLFIRDRDVRFDVLLLHKPVEHGRRAIRCISRKAFGLDVVSRFNAVDHLARDIDFSLTDSAAAFNVHNN